MDFILGGQATGSVASRLMQNNFDPGALRPFLGEDGRSLITVNGQSLVTNAPATLRKDEWKLLDEAVTRAAKPRLRVFGDLRSNNLQYVIPNGMAKTILEDEKQSDIDEATVSMDGLTQSTGDRPLYSLNTLPLPIIHKDFRFSARQVMVSRNGSTPLDTSTAELAARRVAEQIEALTLGTSSFVFGGGTIYGYKNFPSRLTKTLTNPTNVGWTPATLVSEILAMKSQSQAAYHYGPWFCYCAPAWDKYMDDDYSAAKGDLTLRQRIGMIEGIDAPTTADYLTNYDLLLVQKTPDVVRAVIGMDVVTVQWETQGGMELNFKVMAILVPQVRADYNGNTGIVHGSV